jgi:hypothetical protein
MATLIGSAAPEGVATWPQDPDPTPVIDRVLEAYGGAEAVRAIGSHRQDGMLVAARGGSHGRVVRISQGPKKLSILVEYPDRAELRILEEGVALRGPTPAQLVEVSGPLQGAMVLQAARAHLPGLLDDLRGATALEEPVEGRTVLSVRISDDLVLRVFVDDETGYVVRTESVLESAPGPVGFATDYADFREVDGVVFPFREETFASGYHTASTVLESVDLNPEGARARLPVPRGP